MNFQDYDLKAGHLVKTLRTDKNIKQADIANALDMHPKKYWRIENCKKPLTVGQLIIIAQVLGMNITELLVEIAE